MPSYNKKSLEPRPSSQCLTLMVNWTVFLCLVFFPLINYFPEIPPDVYMSDVRMDASLLPLADSKEKIGVVIVDCLRKDD